MEEISQTPEIACFHSVPVAADFIVSVYPNMILDEKLDRNQEFRCDN